AAAGPPTPRGALPSVRFLCAGPVQGRGALHPRPQRHRAGRPARGPPAAALRLRRAGPARGPAHDPGGAGPVETVSKGLSTLCQAITVMRARSTASFRSALTILNSPFLFCDDSFARQAKAEKRAGRLLRPEKVS